MKKVITPDEFIAAISEDPEAVAESIMAPHETDLRVAYMNFIEVMCCLSSYMKKGKGESMCHAVTRSDDLVDLVDVRTVTRDEWIEMTKNPNMIKISDETIEDH